MLQVVPGSLLLCLVLSFTDFGYAKVAPSYIEKCDDPTVQCLTKMTRNALPHFVEGIPKLRIERLDPIYFRRLAIPFSGLDLTLYDGNITGLQNCNVTGVSQEAQSILLEASCNIRVRAKYEAFGRILIFPIDAKGDAEISFEKLTLRLHFWYLRKDKDHIELDRMFVEWKYDNAVTYTLQDLGGDDEDLNEFANDILSQNWKSIAEESGGHLVKFVIARVEKQVVTFFRNVPYEEFLTLGE